MDHILSEENGNSQTGGVDCYLLHATDSLHGGGIENTTDQSFFQIGLEIIGHHRAGDRPVGGELGHLTDFLFEGHQFQYRIHPLRYVLVAAVALPLAGFLGVS
ncbi:hypothetical protein SDC9_198844 [bioreactor metagenome]|uniref:Uncharacterized protein n=1 Tax=bioreactor metagenome TaxID=1076179 RepID=A0A645IK10_9ZZZZ